MVEGGGESEFIMLSGVGRFHSYHLEDVRTPAMDCLR